MSVDEAVEDLESLMTAQQSAALHQTYGEAMTLVNDDIDLGYLAMVALLLEHHPDKQLAAAVRGTCWVAMGLDKYVWENNPIPDDAAEL